MEELIHILNLVSHNQDKTCTTSDFNRRALVQLKELATEKVRILELLTHVKNEGYTAKYSYIILHS